MLTVTLSNEDRSAHRFTAEDLVHPVDRDLRLRPPQLRLIEPWLQPHPGSLTQTRHPDADLTKGATRSSRLMQEA